MWTTMEMNIFGRGISFSSDKAASIIINNYTELLPQDNRAYGKESEGVQERPLGSESPLEGLALG